MIYAGKLKDKNRLNNLCVFMQVCFRPKLNSILLQTLKNNN